MTSDKRQEIREMIKVERERVAASYQNRASAWRSIKRKTKKDGTDFANYRQNFEFEGRVSGVWDDNYGDGSVCLRIYFDTVNENGRKIRDCIYQNLYECIDERDAKWEEMSTAGRIIDRQGVGLKSFYVLTVDEAFEAFERYAKKAEQQALRYITDLEVDEIGVEMYELLEKWCALKKTLENRGGNEGLGIWAGHYSPVRTVLEKTIFPFIR